MKMRRVAVALVLFALTGIAMAQKAEPNSQNPAAPQANTGENKGGTPSQSQAAPATTTDSSAAAQSLGNDDSAALQSRIQNALRDEGSLSGSRVSVSVTARTIELSGTVISTQDKQTADRIAASFDGNRQLSDKIVVTGSGQSSLAPAAIPANPQR